MVTHEDVVELKKVFDDRYVLQSDCTDRQSAVNRKFASDDKRIEIIAHDFSIIKKLIWIVATSAIGQIVIDIVSVFRGA